MTEARHEGADPPDTSSGSESEADRAVPTEDGTLIITVDARVIRGAVSMKDEPNILLVPVQVPTTGGFDIEAHWFGADAEPLGVGPMRVVASVETVLEANTADIIPLTPGLGFLLPTQSEIARAPPLVSSATVGGYTLVGLLGESDGVSLHIAIDAEADPAKRVVVEQLTEACRER